MILTNVIDNAIEACQKYTGDKWIIINLKKHDNELVFSVSNPVEYQLEIKNNILVTRKSDKIFHGIGFKNISYALSKCNGDYSIAYKDNAFVFTAIINLE